MAAAGIAIAAILFTVAMVHCSSFPTTLTLERGFPPTHKLEVSQLREMDSSRHNRTLLQDSDVAIYFPVRGEASFPNVGLYYSRVQMGSPPKDYYVQIDTGSNVLWVSCTSCQGCPAKTELKIPLTLYDPGKSSTSELLPCWHDACKTAIQSSEAFCSSRTDICGFSLKYRDGNAAYGYYLLDLFYMRTVIHENTINTTSAPIVFGCTTIQTGNRTKSRRAVDGILGLGPQPTSVISQLASQNITPKVFAHCLKGDDSGGGLLVLGEVVAPDIVYTPLVPSQSQYKVELQSISVNGKTLDIDPLVFKTSSNKGTIVDSGTTLAYLAEDAYTALVKAISAFALRDALVYPSNLFKCFLIDSSINDLFPQISLNFAGNASMILNPKDYLLKQNSLAGSVWCLGFQDIPGQQVTILGDLVLKDRIVVYDMENQRFGWTNYNCSTAVDISDTINIGTSKRGISSKSSQRNVPYKLIPITMIGLLLHIFTISNYPFL